MTTLSSQSSRYPKAEQLWSDIAYWNEVDRGGHFAAMEQPDIFVNELRKAFRSFRP
jgi:pimeloyl-ACP methyl ester carboxylesterase